MQQERFREDGHLWRSKLKFAVMADDHMLDETPQPWWKISELLEFARNEAQAENDVAEKLALSAIPEAA